MAVLETIRTKIGWLITILIAVALLSFIVDFNSLSSAINSTSSKYAVGEINGKNISYKDFQEQVQYQTTISEILSGGAASSDETQKQIRDAAWQHFIDQNLFIKNAKEAGLEIGKDEMVDLTYGENISPIIQYNPVFMQNGQFDKENVSQFVKNLDADASGNSRLFWNYIQNEVLTKQYYTKYGSLFSATSFANPLVLQDAIEGNNTSATVDIVAVPYGYKTDTTITVSQDEIKKYYKEHKKQFKQVEGRDIKYAYFEIVPSEADINKASEEIQKVYDEFAATENMKNFIMRNSEQSYSENYYKAGELNAVNKEINDFVFETKGEVSPIVKDGNSYLAARVIDTKVLPDSVFVRHILIQNNKELADSLFADLTAGKTPFSQLAAVYSADQNTAVANPGDIGWMTQTYMIPGMEKVMFADINKPFVLDTRYGRHIVEVTKKTAGIEKKQIAILKKTAIPSKATMNEYYSKANVLATAAAGNLDSLIAAAKRSNIYLFDKKITEATDNYNGATHAKEITRWAFDNKAGKASNVISVNQNYLFVVGVTACHKAGYAKVEEAAATIKNTLYNQKKADKTLAEVKEKIEGCTTIEAVAQALGTTVTTSENVTFSSLTQRDNEPAILGAVAGAEQGKIAGPVKGSFAVYVVCVKDRATNAFYTEDDAKSLEDRKSRYNAQMIIPAMLESSDSEDNRERFY